MTLLLRDPFDFLSSCWGPIQSALWSTAPYGFNQCTAFITRSDMNENIWRNSFKHTLKTTGPLLALEPGLNFSILNMVWETSLGSTQECCYLYHCALNVLAVEAISQNKLLWKIRPKLHKILVCISCQKRRGCPRDPVIYQYFIPFCIWGWTTYAMTSPGGWTHCGWHVMVMRTW